MGLPRSAARSRAAGKWLRVVAVKPVAEASPSIASTSFTIGRPSTPLPPYAQRHIEEPLWRHPVRDLAQHVLEPVHVPEPAHEHTSTRAHEHEGGRPKGRVGGGVVDSTSSTS